MAPLPTRFDRIFACVFVGTLVTWLGVLEWRTIYPPWLQWPLLMFGVGLMVGVLWWTGRPGREDQSRS